MFMMIVFAYFGVFGAESKVLKYVVSDVGTE